MREESLKFYCYDSFQKDDEAKWQYLLDYAFQKADEIKFNILYSDQQLAPEIENLADNIVEKGKRSNKINSGNYLKFKLTDQVKNFIKSKKYADWLNFNLEDISFLSNEKEFFVTITHENYIILELTEKQRKELRNKGFDFWCEWEID